MSVRMTQESSVSTSTQNSDKPSCEHSHNLHVSAQSEEKIHPAVHGSFSCRYVQSFVNDLTKEGRLKFDVEFHNEDDRRKESAATRLPLHILQRRFCIFVIGWMSCYLASHVHVACVQWLSAMINALCLAGVNRLRAAPHGMQAFYSSFAVTGIYAVWFCTVPYLWTTFACGLIVEMCVDIDRCCRRVAWKQECRHLSQLKRIDDPPLKVVA